MHPTKFRFICPSGFREDFFFKIGHSETRIACGGHVCYGIGTEDFPQMLPTKFRYIWLNGFREKESKNSGNQKQESPVAAMFINGSRRNEQSLQRTSHRCFLPSFRSFGQAISEDKIFRNRPIRNKNCLWGPCLLTDRNEMSNRNRGLSIDASYHVSVHLVKRFQRRIFKISQSETRIAYGSHVC